MNIVLPQRSYSNSTMPNLLQPIINTPASTLNRKRYLEDLDLLDQQTHKRSRTAPPSPPLATATFTRRSVSPVCSAQLHSVELSPLARHTALITPNSPVEVLAEPVHIERANPVLSIPTTTPVVKLPSFKYLTQNDRHLSDDRHSLEYPDTCVNDDDWRLRLEHWIERNFPEKFNNLKNLLRYDKPGFELLNDAIFLTELKQQLDTYGNGKTPSFTSHISKKMSNKSTNPNFKSYSDHSESEEVGLPWAGSPIPSQPQLAAHPKFPFEANYTYSSSNHDNTPSSKQMSPMKPTSKAQPSPESKDVHKNSPASASALAMQRQWHGHHRLNEDPIIQTDGFIHTQNHKGPNHTYTIHHHQKERKCISCGSDQSPCWRPSWSTGAGQLCNSCGLRYKKTGARCKVKSCCRIPAKGEWATMRARGKKPVTRKNGQVDQCYQCLVCNGEVEVKET